MMASDVVIYREAVEDTEINKTQIIVDDNVAKMAYIRKKEWRVSYSSCFYFGKMDNEE